MDSICAGSRHLYPGIVPLLAQAQLRRVGIGAVVVPVFVALIIGGGGTILSQFTGQETASLLMMLFAPLYTASVGACAVVALSDDPLVELQESTAVGFRTVQLMRLAIVLIGGAIGGLVLFTLLHAAGILPNDAGWLSVLTPVGGAVIIACVAYAAVSFSGSARTATMGIIAVWIFMTLFWDMQIPDPVVQRQVPLAIACAAAGFAWVLSGRSERLLEKTRGVR